MTDIVARRLGPGDGIAVRALRREALLRHPERFCADADAVAAQPEAWDDAVAKSIWFGVEQDGVLVGIVALSRCRGPARGHVGELWAMYVREGARRQGLGEALVRAVITGAIGLVEEIKLTVVGDNPPLVRLYERQGFRRCGRIPRAVKIGETLLDEIIMVRTVSTSD